MPMNGVAVFEHEGEADGPEEDAADAGVGDAFDEDVDRLALAGEARLEHDEADLHAEDQEGGDQRPGGVDGVDRRDRVGCVRLGGAARSGRNQEMNARTASRPIILPVISQATLRRITGLLAFRRHRSPGVAEDSSHSTGA